MTSSKERPTFAGEGSVLGDEQFAQKAMPGWYLGRKEHSPVLRLHRGSFANQTVTEMFPLFL